MNPDIWANKIDCSRKFLAQTEKIILLKSKKLLFNAESTNRRFDFYSNKCTKATATVKA